MRALVHGQVQGVGYRAFARGEARRLALSGWVRNLPDGSVEVMAAGPGPDLVRLVDRLREGPPAGSVTRIDLDWDAGPGSDTASFEVCP